MVAWELPAPHNVIRKYCLGGGCFVIHMFSCFSGFDVVINGNVLISLHIYYYTLNIHIAPTFYLLPPATRSFVLVRFNAHCDIPSLARNLVCWW